MTAAVLAPAPEQRPAARGAELVGIVLAETKAQQASDRRKVAAVADMIREGIFAHHGYRSPAAALADLINVERVEAQRLVTAAEAVETTVTLTGDVLPPRLPATAMVFGSDDVSLRHVEVIARLLDSPSARRLDPQTLADAEVQLAGYAVAYKPSVLQKWGRQLIETLDQDGARPDDRPLDQLNELRITRFRTKPGGKIAGSFESAMMFDAIANVIDALSAARDADDQRDVAERQAEALADACTQVLNDGEMPERGGRRPQLIVTTTVDQLEGRLRGASLEFGDRLEPAELRHLACDAGVIPMVLNGEKQPLDVGHSTRTIPDPIRRAVTVRDQGCAHPGCDRPPSWSEIHHLIEWQHGGPTKINNLVMLCRVHHRLVHASGWEIQMERGAPVFIPPYWIDPTRTPRRRPPPMVRHEC